jgi:hypothetical protein
MPRQPSTCSVQDCEILANRGNGMCEKHYYRLRRHGDVEKRLRNANGEGTAIKVGKYSRVTINGERVQAHVAIVEAVLGRSLPAGAEIHHVNEDKTDNRHENLVVCPDRAYHQLLHARTRALDSCGDANKRTCRHCHEYDSLDQLVKNGTSYYHLACAAGYQREYKTKQRGSNAVTT